MPSNLVQRFIDCLHELDRSGESRGMIDLFSEHCRVSNTASPRIFEGKQQAADFWRIYRATFDRIDTEFFKVIESGSLVALEWTSRGKLANGGDFSYDGVTMLEVNEDEIVRFHSYFNPAALRTGIRGETNEDAPVQAGAPGGSDEANVQTSDRIPENEATDASYASPGRTP